MTATIEPITEGTPSFTAPDLARTERSLVERQLEALRPQLTAILADTNIPLASFEVAVLQAELQEPDLNRCTAGSVAEAILACARLGLMPAGLEDHVALAAKRHDDGSITAECMAMVNGLVHLSLRDGGAVDIDGETVRKGETYKFSKLTKTLEHEPVFPRDPEIIAAYAFADMKDGRRIAELMDIAEIELAEAAGRGRNSIAWRNFRPRMAIKSAKKRLILTRGLLSAATTAALSRVRVEMDVAPVPAPDLVAQPAAAASTPPAGGASREGMSPVAAKLFDKIEGAARSGGAQPSAPATPPAAPAPSSSPPAAPPQAAKAGKGKAKAKAAPAAKASKKTTKGSGKK